MGSPARNQYRTTTARAARAAAAGCAASAAASAAGADAAITSSAADVRGARVGATACTATTQQSSQILMPLAAWVAGVCCCSACCGREQVHHSSLRGRGRHVAACTGLATASTSAAAHQDGRGRIGDRGACTVGNSTTSAALSV
jgi:hypothetical protein